MLSSYLFRSFKRRPMRHISLVWIMLCAFLLPLVVSVYRDSLTYGVQLQNFDFHKGYVIHITGVQPEDVQYFRDIDGLTEPYYEDGTIYMNYDSKESEERYQEIHEGVALSVLLKTRVRGSKQPIDVFFYDTAYNPLEDAYIQTTFRNMQAANLALLLFSGLIVQAAYRNHLDSFSGELAELSAVGAEKGQILRMFLAELACLFPLSAAGAVGIAYAVMRLLYEKFLGNTAASVAIWRVFHMDPKSTAVQIGFYLLVCLGAMVFALRKKPAPLRMGRPQKTASLSRLWVKRTKTPYVPCLAILVPLTAAFVILFSQYLGSYAEMLYSSQDAEIILQTPRENFSQGELDIISGTPGVRRVELTWDFSEPYLLAPNGGESKQVSLCLSEEPLEKYQIKASLPGAAAGTYYLCRITRLMDAAEVTLIPQAGDEARVFVSPELMQELVRGWNQVVVHTTPDRAAAVEEALGQSLGASIDISNFQNYVDTTLAQQEGQLWLLSWMFAILMLAAMQIVWARLARYVRDCAPMLRIVQQVGASRQQIARLIPVRLAALPGAVLPFLIALPWAWWDAGRNGRPFILSLPVAGIYLGVAVLVVITFWLPVKVTLRKVVK